MSFDIAATDGKARTGKMSFPRGEVATPAFMPVGTYGTVKDSPPSRYAEREPTFSSVILFT
jgi:queuine tRNA-ribosyltransferase